MSCFYKDVEKTAAEVAKVKIQFMGRLRWLSYSIDVMSFVVICHLKQWYLGKMFEGQRSPDNPRLGSHNLLHQSLQTCSYTEKKETRCDKHETVGLRGQSVASLLIDRYQTLKALSSSL